MRLRVAGLRRVVKRDLGIEFGRAVRVNTFETRRRIIY